MKIFTFFVKIIHNSKNNTLYYHNSTNSNQLYRIIFSCWKLHHNYYNNTFYQFRHKNWRPAIQGSAHLKIFLDRIGRLLKKLDRIGRLLKRLDRIGIGSVAFWKNWIGSGSDRSPFEKIGSETDPIPIQLCWSLLLTFKDIDNSENFFRFL